MTFSRAFCLNFDTNFHFFIIIEFSIKPSRNPTSDPPRDPDLANDLRLETTALKSGESITFHLQREVTYLKLRIIEYYKHDTKFFKLKTNCTKSEHGTTRTKVRSQDVSFGSFRPVSDRTTPETCLTHPTSGLHIPTGDSRPTRTTPVRNYFFTPSITVLLPCSQNCEKRLLASSFLSVCPHGTTRVVRLSYLDVSLCRQQRPKCDPVIRPVCPPLLCKLRSSSNPTNKNLTELGLEIQISLSR
jgi:hypothetical protein